MCSDIYITETSRHADIIFPAASGLEIPQYDISFHNHAIRNTAKYAPPLFPKKGEVKHDWEILQELTAKITQEESNGQTPESILEMLLQMGHYAKEGLTLQKLKDHPHGVDLGPLKPCLMDRLQTNDDTIRLAPQVMLDDLKRLGDTNYKQPANDEYPFKMIGRRLLRQHNTWTQNSYRLSKGRNECTAEIHPEDAKRLGVEDRSFVHVSSRVGKIKIEVDVTDDIMPGVVSIPQGFGTSKKSSMTIAADQNSVSINDLTDEMRVDLLTGNAALNGVAVKVEVANQKELKEVVV